MHAELLNNGGKKTRIVLRDHKTDQLEFAKLRIKNISYVFLAYILNSYVNRYRQDKRNRAILLDSDNPLLHLATLFGKASRRALNRHVLYRILRM